MTRLQTDLVDKSTKSVCTSDTKLQTDFARGATNIPNLGNNAARTQTHNDLFQERSGYRQGYYGQTEVYVLGDLDEKREDAGGMARGALDARG